MSSFADLIQCLEELRRQAEAAENHAGSLGDYLDRARPSETEAREAYEEMQRSRAEAEGFIAELSNLLAQLRRDAPEAVAAWAERHRAACQAMRAGTPARDQDFLATRDFVIGETLAEWEKVLRGEQDYVRINWYFMEGYEQFWEQITDE
ncbi:MAG: hypothetical protein JW987_12100 [Anaerolineaceae bacterium]|nr:hypothetical protein [Anaerolineaceae bacterium]